MKRTSIPQTDSIQELAYFWDTHDLTDFEDELEEVGEYVFEMNMNSMNRSNLFNPFDSRSRQSEDRLTWAFVVGLKYDPSLQSLLRELVESRLPPELRKYGNTWEPANVSTQTKWIKSTTNLLVSVLLTDARIQEEIRVEWSDREPRYDGVIEYPNGLTLIVENKPSHGNVWEEQLSPSRASFSGEIDDVYLYSSAICLEWSEILEGVLRYADSGIAPFSSREIARDFLSFVEEVHPALTPYRTFELCGERPEALERRNASLLATLASETGLENWGYLFRPGKIAERVFISISESKPWKLQVELFPANTVTQARHFYNAVDRESFLSLEEWKVELDLHFFSWPPSSWNWIGARSAWETRDYLDYFSQASYGRMDRDRLLSLAEQYVREGLITSEDLDKIRDLFRNTNIQRLNVVPGFYIYREWDLDTVIELEKRGELKEYIIDALATPLATWGETL